MARDDARDGAHSSADKSGSHHVATAGPIDRRALLAASLGLPAMMAAGASRASPQAHPAAKGHQAVEIIDVHAHFVPDIYRTAAVAAGHAQPDGMPAIPAWSEAEMIAMMDRQGIRTAFLSISSPGVHFGDDAAARDLARAVNREGARLKTAHPGRIGSLASLPLPDVAGALAEIAFALDTLKADGVIIESNSAGIYLGDPRFDPVLAELDRRGAVVLLHPTSPHCPACSRGSVPLPAPVLEFMFETTRAVTNLILTKAIDRFPRIKFVIPHAGAALPALIDRIVMTAGIIPSMAGTSPQAIMDSVRSLHFDLAGAPVPRLLAALRSVADPTRLLYGSDWPFTPEIAVAMLRQRLDEALAGDPAERAAILSGNARRLFPRLAS